MKKYALFHLSIFSPLEKGDQGDLKEAVKGQENE